MLLARIRLILGSLLVGSTGTAIGAVLPAAIAHAQTRPPQRLAYTPAKVQYFSLHQQGLWLQVNSFGSKTNATALNLWATYYYIHQARATGQGEELLDLDGRSLGIKLAKADWCNAAMQGTVQVFSQTAFLNTFNFAGRGSDVQVDCSDFFKSLSGSMIDRVGRARFSLSPTPLGYGAGKTQLVEFRSIAVDPDQIPLGSIVYIPAARGQVLTLSSGDRVVHDGFFYAADVGSAIRGNHIDVFLGPTRQNPFPFVTSTSRQPFRAYLIQDPDIARAFQAIHIKIR